MPYSFGENPYPGAPHYNIHVIRPFEPFDVEGIKILPVQVNHFILEIVGFVIGRLAYITDAKHLYPATLEAIAGVDTLVVNALREGKEHPSHFTLEEALEVVGKLKPRQAFLTHFSHEIGLTSELTRRLPPNVYPAHDGLSVEIPD